MNAGCDAPEGLDRRLRSPAVLVGLLALFAAALAMRLALGAPPERHSRAGAAAPAQRMCFCGPGGEVLDFPANDPRRLRLAAAAS